MILIQSMLDFENRKHQNSNLIGSLVSEILILSINFNINILLRLFTLPQSRTYIPRDLQAKCPWARCLQGEQQSLNQNTREIHKGESPLMCGQHNVRASAEDNTRQNTFKGNTPNPRTEIKTPDPARNRTWAARLEGRDSTDHATATESIIFHCFKLLWKFSLKTLAAYFLVV